MLNPAVRIFKGDCDVSRSHLGLGITAILFSFCAIGGVVLLAFRPDLLPKKRNSNTLDAVELAATLQDEFDLKVSKSNQKLTALSSQNIAFAAQLSALQEEVGALASKIEGLMVSGQSGESVAVSSLEKDVGKLRENLAEVDTKFAKTLAREINSARSEAEDIKQTLAQLGAQVREIHEKQEAFSAHSVVVQERGTAGSTARVSLILALGQLEASLHNKGRFVNALARFRQLADDQPSQMGHNSRVPSLQLHDQRAPQEAGTGQGHGEEPHRVHSAARGRRRRDVKWTPETHGSGPRRVLLPIGCHDALPRHACARGRRSPPRSQESGGGMRDVAGVAIWPIAVLTCRGGTRKDLAGVVGSSSTAHLGRVPVLRDPPQPRLVLAERRRGGADPPNNTYAGWGVKLRGSTCLGLASLGRNGSLGNSERGPLSAPKCSDENRESPGLFIFRSVFF